MAIHNKFLFFIYIFIAILLSSTSFSKQKVYLLRNIDISRLHSLRSQNPNCREQTLRNLIENRYLVEVNIELARELFNIVWETGEENLSEQPPQLLLAHMGENIGYALFTLALTQLKMLPKV